MFNNLKELTIREFTNHKETAIKTLLEQNLTTAMQYYTTKLRQQQYHNQEITKDKAKEIAKKGIIKHWDKKLKEELEKIDAIVNAEDLQEIELLIDYKTKVMAFLKINNKKEYCTIASNQTNGDQLSAATASVLNSSLEVKKVLYSTIEKHLNEGVDIKQIEQFVGYGLHYGIPSFINGAGVDSFMRIFQNLGFTVKERQLNNARLYTIERKGQQ